MLKNKSKGSVYLKMKKLLKIGVVVLMASSLFASLFGCINKTPQKQDYPFDTAKAYCYRRSGVISGGNCRLTAEPQGIVTYYSYVKYPPENECGMKDKGADIFFVGLKEGKVKITLEYMYPTTESDFEEFTLSVDSALNVTLSE